MIARDVMTRDVVSVTSDTNVRKIASLLVKNGISAVPVVNGGGAPIGIVSEGDLIGREEAECEAREDWWLTLLAEGEALSRDFLDSLNYPTAHDVMSAPVITVGEETGLREIAEILTIHQIKRVPVLRDGRIVGIVSRADLVGALVLGMHTSVLEGRN